MKKELNTIAWLLITLTFMVALNIFTDLIFQEKVENYMVGCKFNNK